jgi:nitrite reductase (NADH) small subunit
MNGSACVKLGQRQVALFRFEEVAEVLAIENRCPHRQVMVLSRGITGTEGERLKVSCPMHKHCFDLRTGEHIGGETDWKRQTFKTPVENDRVYIQSPEG